MIGSPGKLQMTGSRHDRAKLPEWWLGFLLFLPLHLPALGQLPAPPILTPEEHQVFQQRAKVLPGAKQSGPGCAFFANVPALTMASGIHIADDSAASRSFVASVYALRKGDFEIHSAFDREIFFALFGIPAEGRKIYYGDRSKVELVRDAEGLVLDIFGDALKRGRFVSLRVTGELGRAHNVLLLGHRDGKYWYHDPTMGKMRTADSQKLAMMILTESSTSGKRPKKRYFSSYHLIAVDAASASEAPVRRISDLPAALAIELSEAQAERLSKALTPRPAASENVSGLEAVEQSFPQISFAMISREVKGKTKRINAIGNLQARDLLGVAAIAKLSINSYGNRARDLLPVIVLGKQPCVITAYSAAPTGSQGSGPTLTLFDGKTSRSLPVAEVLDAFKKSGSMFGHVSVPRD